MSDRQRITPWQLMRDWVSRYLSDPQAVVLVLLLLLLFGVIVGMGEMLAPVLAAIVIAYLLEGVVRKLQLMGIGRRALVGLVFTLFMLLLLVVLIGLTPLVWVQTVDLARQLPGYIATLLEMLQKLPEAYPNLLDEAQLQKLMQLIQTKSGEFVQFIVSASISSIPSLITLLVYAVLVPMLVFFFLSDKENILRWFTNFLPNERPLMNRVWHEVDQQIGNYVRGKFWEIVIVGIATYVVFAIVGIKYAMLLSVLVGLSVVVPYIGALVVTIPIAVVGYFQWGMSAEYGWVMGAYLVIQALDGNVLVPLLFSGAVNMHPVAIIVAVLVFGGLFGFWGVFFAIPLATLVNALLSSWPRPKGEANAAAGES